MTATIRNRVTEKDLRDWLSSQGYVGKFAKVDELELHAIERPGWTQVFRFQVEVREIDIHGTDDRPWLKRWGVILDDERKRKEPTAFWMYDSQEPQLEQLSQLAAGKLVLRHGKTSEGFVALAIAGFAILVVALIVNWLFPGV